MRTPKKLLITLLAATSIVTLSSCNSDARNTSIPMGNINTESEIASIKDTKLTNGKYYTRLRASGYETVHNQIKKALFKTELAAVNNKIKLDDDTVTDVEQDVFDAIANALFSSTDKETIEKLTDEEIDAKIKKYIDANNNKGITVTEEECKSYSFVEDKIKFSKLNSKLIENNLLSIAINEAAKAKLETIVDSEEIENEEGKLVTNTYHISEKNIKNYYESSFKNNGTYNAIIIQFNNLTEAKNAIKAATTTVGEINDTNAAEFYAVLYNSYYKYRTHLDLTNPFSSEETKFVVNDEEDELTKISASIKNFVTNTLEDGDYLDTPFNLNNKYIMVYRNSTTYDLNVKYSAKSNEAIDWSDLKDEVGQANYDKIHAEVRSELIDNKISTYTSTIIKDRIKAAEIEIYDPYFENKFQTAYSDYEIIDKKDFENDLIFKVAYENDEITYSVEEFYNEQSSSNGLTVIVDLLKLDYVYQYKNIFYTDEQIEDYEKAVDKAVETFNKGENANFAKELGLETYLLSTYGYTTVADAKYASVAGNVLTKYLSHSVFDEWANNEDHTINYDKLNVLQNMLDYGNAYYKGNNLFSINIDHMLIYLDDNSDGNPDDPEEFISKLSDVEKTEFNNALLALSQAIYAEANCKELTDSNNLMEILNYIVKAYTRNEKLYSNPDKTWADYKKYNFILKVESLSSSGDTTESNVNNYVKPFADYVKELYKQAVANKLTVDDEAPIFYFTTSGEKAPSTIDDLCATQFGYHMIVVNDYSEPEGTDIKESDDKYSTLKEFDVLINEKDSDDEEDNIYVTVENVYNEKTNEATMNQFFTYYVEKRMGASSTLNTNIQSLFNSMFGDAIARYTSNAFQTFLLVNDMNITITNEDIAKRFVGYKQYLINNSQSYKADDEFASWYDGSLDWTRPYQK